MPQVITAIVHRELRFTDRRGDEKLFSGGSRQRVSSAIASHPYFLAAMASGWVTDVQAVDSESGEAKPYRATPPPPPKQNRR